MLRRTWNAFLDGIETVIELVAYRTGPSLNGRTPPDLGKTKPR